MTRYELACSCGATARADSRDQLREIRLFHELTDDGNHEDPTIEPITTGGDRNRQTNTQHA